MGQCWASVADAGPTLTQRLAKEQLQPVANLLAVQEANILPIVLFFYKRLGFPRGYLPRLSLHFAHVERRQGGDSLSIGFLHPLRTGIFINANEKNADLGRLCTNPHRGAV